MGLGLTAERRLVGFGGIPGLLELDLEPFGAHVESVERLYARRGAPVFSPTFVSFKFVGANKSDLVSFILKRNKLFDVKICKEKFRFAQKMQIFTKHFALFRL